MCAAATRYIIYACTFTLLLNQEPYRLLPIFCLNRIFFIQKQRTNNIGLYKKKSVHEFLQGKVV